VTGAERGLGLLVVGFFITIGLATAAGVLTLAWNHGLTLLGGPRISFAEGVALTLCLWGLIAFLGASRGK
jgi:hypothetical protein